MTTFYVATRARYVLVDALDEAEARVKGETALYDLYADLRQNLGREVPIIIQTIRPANPDEIDMMKWHNANLAREAEWRVRRQER